MATKEAVFKLRVDTGNSVADINAADKAIQGFNKDLQQTKTIQADSKGSDNFAAKLAAIDQKVKAGGLGIRELSRVIREYQSVAIAAGEESVVGRNAIAQAGALKDRINDLQSQTKVASSDFKNLDLAIAGIGTGAAVFQGLTGAIALTGIENEELTKTMVKLQAAQGIANAVNQVALALNSDAVLGIKLRIGIEKVKNFVMGDSAKTAKEAAAGETLLSGANTAVGGSATFASIGLKALKVAMIATGVGVLIAGLGMLIANFDKVKDVVLNAEEKFRNLGTTGKAIAGIFLVAFAPIVLSILGIRKAMEALGLIDDATTRKAKSNAIARTTALVKEKDKAILESKTRQTANDKYYTHEINLLNASGKSTYEMSLKKARAHLFEGRIMLAAQKEKFAAYQQELKMLIATGDGDSDRVKKLKTSLTDSYKAIKENFNDLVDTRHQIEVMEVEHKHNTTKTQKESSKEKVEIVKKEAVTKIEIIKTTMQDELDALEKAEDLKISMMVEGKDKQEAILDETYGDFREALIRKSNKKEIDLLDSKFNKNKINEQQYRDGLKKIMETGEKNFSQAELDLMTLTTNKLNDDKRRLKLSAQELELEDALRSFEAGDLTAVQHLEKQQEINDKYAKIAIEKAAKIETEKRNRRNLINDIMLDDEQLALQKVNDDFEDNKKKLLAALNSTNENEKITQEQHDDALIELEKKKQKSINKIKEDALKTQIELNKKKFLDDNKQLNDIIEGAQKAQAFANEINSVINQAADQKIQETNNRRDAELASLDAQQQQELNQAGLTAEQKTAIEQKFAIAKYNVQKKAFDIEDKLNRQKFNREKALNMTSIVISTAAAVMKSIAENGGVPAGVPFGIASGVLGAAQLAVVASSKYQGGSAPTMPSFSGGAGSTGASGEQFAPITPATTTTTAGLLGNASNTPTTGQVFVLESDISQVQNNVMVAEIKSKF
jgi:hypothetical protein